MLGVTAVRHLIPEAGERSTDPIREYHYRGEMPIVQCPIEGCEYRTLEVDPVLAAVLTLTHVTVHAAPHPVPPVAKAEKVERPSISSARTTEDW